ncbi:MAG: DUF1273 domain-containing protein [Clostridia bacterium]|nr:DUF1273 domain-containing protein [Clostridia bacterium]
MFKRCAFSGHRNLNTGGFDASLLDRVVYDLIKTGTTEFYCGMALGFDIAAAESVLLQRNEKVTLTACLPCADQKETFSQSGKLRYQSVLERCDRVITLASEYYSGCMHARDRFMVDNCDVLVCFLRKQSGGTFYTVNYAKKCGKKIIEL